MQQKAQTFGGLLSILCEEKQAEKKEEIKLKLENMIEKFSGDENVLTHFINEAFKGSKGATLGRNVLIPDWTEHDIITRVEDHKTVVTWCKEE